MHTENEARKLWCPLARVVNNWFEPAVAVNRSILKGKEKAAARDEKEIDAGCGCIASECAMWRWEAKDSGYCGIRRASP
jgi:hypothetical protein